MMSSRRGVAVVGPDAAGCLADAVSAGGADVVGPEHAEGVVFSGGDPHDLHALLDAWPIAWVQLPSAGVEKYFATMRRHPRLAWTSAKGIYGPSVAEHALAMLLALRRGLLVHAAARTWTPDVSSRPLVSSGDTVTLLGGGGIAIQLAHLLAPFGTRTRVVRRDGHALFPAPHDRIFAQDDLASACSGADALVITLPLTEQTRGLVGEAELRQLTRGAAVVNVGRGAVLDHLALLALLDDGALSGAALDVTEPEPLPSNDPLWAHPRCLITSHTANPEDWRVKQLCRLVQENTARFVNDQQLLGTVDAEAGH